MKLIWNAWKKNELTCFGKYDLSNSGKNEICKKIAKTSKILEIHPSLLSAYAGLYISNVFFVPRTLVRDSDSGARA